LSRRTLSDAQWGRIADLAPGKAGDSGATGKDNRLLVDAVLWIARTGAPWRDLPPELGNWNSTWRRFDRWSARGVWERLFAALADDPDFEYVAIDATVVRAHQHGAGGKGGPRLRPSAARAAARARSSMSRSTRSATRCGSRCRRASGTR
jgi:transposase